MRKFDCVHEHRVSQRRYEQIDSIFHPRRRWGRSDRDDGAGSIPFSVGFAGLILILVIGILAYNRLYQVVV